MPRSKPVFCWVLETSPTKACIEVFGALILEGWLLHLHRADAITRHTLAVYPYLPLHRRLARLEEYSRALLEAEAAYCMTTKVAQMYIRALLGYLQENSMTPPEMLQNLQKNGVAWEDIADHIMISPPAALNTMHMVAMLPAAHTVFSKADKGDVFTMQLGRMVGWFDFTGSYKDTEHLLNILEPRWERKGVRVSVQNLQTP
jgi:hypothetical protein